MSNYKKIYEEKIVKSLKDEFKYSTVMQVPKLEKIVINMGCGDGARDQKFIDAALKDLEQITGQKAVVTKAKKSIAGFKLRAGQNELTYIAAKKDSFESTIENNGVVGYFAATAGDAADEELPIYFKTTTELTYAGTYTDTVTFSFEEVSIE